MIGRRRSGSGCCDWLAASTSEAIRTPCAAKGSIVTCFASTSSPNIWKWIRPSSRRFSASRGDCRRRRRRTDRPRNWTWPNTPTASRPEAGSDPWPMTATESLTSSPAKTWFSSTFRPNDPRQRRWETFVFSFVLYFCFVISWSVATSCNNFRIKTLRRKKKKSHDLHSHLNSFFSLLSWWWNIYFFLFTL